MHTTTAAPLPATAANQYAPTIADYHRMSARVIKLEAANAELVAALRDLVSGIDNGKDWCGAQDARVYAARAALAKAEQ
jgi:hypothetical protein